MPALVKNNATGQLNAGISNSATSLTLKSGQGARFPSIPAGTLPSGLSDSATSLTLGSGQGASFAPGLGGSRFATITEGTLSEIIRITGRSTDTLTIQRSQRGTTAQTFTSAATISGYPDDYYYVTLSNSTGTTVEIVQVKARSSDTLSIIRAREGTSASAFSTDDPVELRITAGIFGEKVGKVRTRVIRVGGSYTPAEDVIAINVILTGGGGSGGGALHTTATSTSVSTLLGGGGGGSGATVLFSLNKADWEGSAMTVTIGNGGAAPASGTLPSGNDGSASKFVVGGITVEAGGGKRGGGVTANSSNLAPLYGDAGDGGTATVTGLAAANYVGIDGVRGGDAIGTFSSQKVGSLAPGPGGSSYWGAAPNAQQDNLPSVSANVILTAPTSTAPGSGGAGGGVRRMVSTGGVSLEGFPAAGVAGICVIQEVLR